MRPLSLLLGLLAAVALAGTTFAQGAGDLPVTPDPSECTVEAPTVDELIALSGSTPTAGTPDIGDEDAMASPEAFALPEGEPADEETTAAVVATLRELLACVNSGNFLYIFPFLTEDLIAREFLAEPLTEEEAEFFRATPPALPEEQHGTLVAVREATALPDGRVGALVETIFPEEEEGVQVDYFIFEEADGRWLIDLIVEDLEGQYPPTGMATPAA